MVYRIALPVLSVLVLLGCAATNLPGGSHQTEKRSGLEANDDQTADVCASVSNSEDDGLLLACFSSHDEVIAVSDVIRWDRRSRFSF